MGRIRGGTLRALAASATLALAPTHAPAADASQHLELFLASEGVFGAGNVRQVDDDSWINADINAGVAKDQFRTFGEFYATAEVRVLDRLELGYELSLIHI